MKGERQWQVESKTISTNPSIHGHYPSAIHSYHQYQSLLHYITSFITDFRINVIQLKQAVYNLIGEENPLSHTCQQCEVQYMMNTCRKTREDIIRMTSLMRGYITNNPSDSRSKGYIVGENRKEGGKGDAGGGSGVGGNQKSNVSFCVKNDGYGSVQLIQKKLPNSSQQLNVNDIGFITFRENLIVDRYTSKIKKSQNIFIQQQNHQSSSSSVYNRQQHLPYKKSNKKINKSQNQNQREQQFKKAFNLIAMMRCQFKCSEHHGGGKKIEKVQKGEDI